MHFVDLLTCGFYEVLGIHSNVSGGRRDVVNVFRRIAQSYFIIDVVDRILLLSHLKRWFDFFRRIGRRSII